MDQKVVFEDVISILKPFVKNTDALQSVAMEMKREGRLAAVTDSLRKAIRIEVHEDRLRTIPWPPPLSPPGT